MAVFVLEQAGPPQRHVTAGKEEGDTVPLGFFSRSGGVPHTVAARAGPGVKGQLSDSSVLSPPSQSQGIC